MMRVRSLGAILIALLAVSGCTRPGERVMFDGKYYPTKARKGETREQFTVTVRRAAQGIDGAREAGRFEATRYCIETVGDSTIHWTRGPDGAGGPLVTEGGNLVLSGSCVKW